MTDPALIERITRSLAFMLRHQPETFDLELDAHGFSDLDDVVHALNERLGEPIEEEDVREAVQSGDRPRYQIEGDRIRALYGHSIPVEPGPSSKPPEFLYVAIPASELERARRFGLRGGRRRFLHLAITKEDAAESGRRASRSYAILLIHALDAWEEGVSFFDRVALWLAEEVPTHLIEVEGTYDDGVEPLRRHEHEREQGGYSERGPERGRGHERHAGHGGGDGRGRRRRRGGRGRDRHRDDGARGERREGGRGPEAEGFRPEPGREREPAFDAAPAGRGEREHRRESFPAQERGRDERPRDERPRDERPRDERPRDERPREERPREEGRGRDGRRERDEFRTERRPRPEPAAHGERERSDSRPVERRPEPPRRERAPLPSSAPGGGFGAGLEAHEPPREREREREREARPAPPPPAAPARRDPPEADRPRFGAGL
jgi:putative RNA 2'-phosphotransferase